MIGLLQPRKHSKTCIDSILADAPVNLVLTWEIAQSSHLGVLSQIDHKVVRQRFLRPIPASMPECFRSPVHDAVSRSVFGEHLFTVRVNQFPYVSGEEFAVRIDDIEFRAGCIGDQRCVGLRRDRFLASFAETPVQGIAIRFVGLPP